MARGKDYKSKSVKRKHSPSNSSVVEQYPPGDDIIKSPLDPNSYKIIQLPNGLKVILTSTLEPDIDLRNPVLRAAALKRIQEFNTKFVKLPNSPKQDEMTSQEDEDEQPQAKKQKLDVTPEYRSKSKNHKSKWSKQKWGRKKNRNSKNTFQGIVALVVGVGSFQDPPDFPGMAHFCEHCITFGSKRYPKKKALQTLIKNTGGSWSATTYPERTVYAFEILAQRGPQELEVFKTAIDILSDTMTNALMPENWITKEVHAINSEFCIRTLDEYRRFRQMLRGCAEDKHPVQNFSTGNLESLQHGNFYTKLCEWKDKYYNAGNMTLAITAPKTIDELEKIVVQYFSRIPGRDLKEPTPSEELLKKFSHTPYATNKFRSFYKIVPATNTQGLSICWELPLEMWKNYETRPLTFIACLFRDDSPIAQSLWEKHWILELYVNTQFSSPFSSILQIWVSLTDSGFKEVNRVIETIFSYLKTLSSSSVDDKWFLKEFDKFRRLKANSFHFCKNFTNFQGAKDLATRLQLVQKNREILTSFSIVTKFDPGVIRRCLGMLTPRTANFMLLSRAFLKNSTPTDFLIEPWYKTRYQVNKLSAQELRRYENVKIFKNVECPELDLMDFDLPSKVEILSATRELLNTKRASVTYTNETATFSNNKRIPMAQFSFWISSYFLNIQHPQGIVWMKIWKSMLVQRLRAVGIPENSDLFHTNLTIMDNTDFGVAISGPTTGKLSEMFELIIEEFECFEEETDELEFNSFKELQIKNYEDETFDIDGFYQDYKEFILCQNHLLFDQKKVIAENTSFTDFIDFIRKFKTKMFVSGELKGVVLDSQAKHVTQIIDKMAYDAVPLVFCIKGRAMQLPLGENCLIVDGKNPDNPISIIANYYQFGILDKEAKERVKWIASLIKYPAFLQLRTEEQLSYIVSTTFSEHKNACGITVKVKALASTHTAGYVDERIDTFFASFHKQNICSQSKLSEILTANEIDFCAEDLTHIQQMFADYLLPDGKYFRKISFQILGSSSGSSSCCQNSSPPKEMSKTVLALKIKKAKSRGTGCGVNVYFIKDIVAFKKNMRCFAT